MRVKVGNEWHEPEAGKPIMIELTKQDKKNIADMLPKATLYAIFADEDKRSYNEMKSWMDR